MDRDGTVTVTIPERTRRRLTAVLFTGVSIGRTGYIAAVTVTTLVAKEMLGSATLAGVPGAVTVLGSALGGDRLSAYMERHGRRRGLVLGYAAMAAGAAGAATATALGSFPLLVGASAVFGFGASADSLSRYAAADVHPAERRGAAIAIVVWAGTIGSVLGPTLLSPAEGVGRALGIEPLAGSYVIAAALAALALMVIAVLLRPDPLEFADRGTGVRPTGRITGSATVWIAVASLAIGQMVMVLIMVMTPLHVRDHGHTLGTVGVIIAAHTFGMFAVSPLTGWVADRIGRLPVILAGQAILAIAAVTAALADESAIATLTVALFLLGLGWNLSYVAGSALLTEGAAPENRVRLQGFGDAVVWTAGAVASVSSGLLLEAGSYAILCVVGACLTVVPVTVTLRVRATT
ncbi:MAG TPA: MFS transporter [Actinobacteria bacterium]|nr:MFS transporter [Actinomycetota bacterium]